MEESKRNTNSSIETNGQKIIPSSELSQNALDDLLSLGLGQPTTINNSQAPSTSAQAYNTSILDPWGGIPEPSKNESKSSGRNLFFN